MGVVRKAEKRHYFEQNSGGSVGKDGIQRTYKKQQR